MATTPNLVLELFVEPQPNASTLYNETLLWLDAAIPQFRPLDRDLTAPPGSPAVGDLYLVATSGSGAWAGKDGQMALWTGGGWAFRVVREGWTMWVQDENVHLVHNGSAWVAV